MAGDESKVPPLPQGIGAPATRALVGAGFTNLGQLNGVSSEQLQTQHGVGPAALKILQTELERIGMSLG